MSKFTISESLEAKLICKKDGHDNKRLEFVNTSEEAEEMFLCSRCLIKVDPKFFMDIIPLDELKNISEKSNINKMLIDLPNGKSA